VEVATPFDQALSGLSADLNKTYVAFGRAGQAGAANQAAQDANAAALSPSAAASRAGAKASSLYVNRWDLVDAAREKGFDLETVKAEDLPENMQKMSVEERKSYVSQMEQKRAEVQRQVAELSAKRQAYIQEQQKRGGPGDSAFDAAVRKAMREQAEKKGFSFE
jgi:hypothetical protein